MRELNEKVELFERLFITKYILYHAFILLREFSFVFFLKIAQKIVVAFIFFLTSKQTRGLVSKETVVLYRSRSETQKFGFINRVEKVK